MPSCDVHLGLWFLRLRTHVHRSGNPLIGHVLLTEPNGFGQQNSLLEQIMPYDETTATQVEDIANSEAVQTATTEATAAIVALDPFASARPLDTDNLEAALASARKAFTDAGNNAANAAARAFVVWYYCQSPVATGDMRTAYEKQREAKNTAIKKHNDQISDQVKAAKKRTAERREQLVAEIPGVNDPERKGSLEAELAGLDDKLDTEITALREGSWVKVGERSGALPFTEEVKFTLDLVRRQQATQVNRYANAVGWIHDTLFDQGTLLAQKAPNAAEIAKQIIEAGGVENVAKVQKEARDDKDAKTDRRHIAAAVVKNIEDHFKSVAPVAEASMGVDMEDGNLVALIARKAGSNVALLRSMQLDDGEMNSLLTQHIDPDDLPGHAETEFVGETLAASGAIDKAVMTCPDGNTIVVSFREMEDGAPVIYATPKGSAASILPGDGAVMMETEQLAALRKRLGSSLERKLVGIRIAADRGMIEGKCPMPAAFAWQSENSALLAENRPAARALHQWVSLEDVTKKPHEVRGFTPIASVLLDRSALVKLQKGQLEAWKTDQSATKSKLVAKLRYDGASFLSLECSKGTDTVPAAPAGDTPARTVELTVHPKGLADMLDVLRKTSATRFTLALDTDGALRVGWETAYGHYVAYLPECREGRKFETRLIRPMR